VNGKPISWAALQVLMKEPKFTAHQDAVRKLGFELHAKRAAVGTTKHIRVRPQFAAGWQLQGLVQVFDEQIDDKAVKDFFFYAGQYKGLGDWRPGAPKKPGPYGTFDAKIS
jgi:hypothetical protein